MPSVNVKLVEGTMGVASAGPHAFVVDRSLEKGGTYLGMVGGEILLSAVGSCLLTTLVGAARARNIELFRVEFKVSAVHEDAPSRYTSIQVEAIVEADASDDEIEKLIAIAERGCTVSNTIVRGAAIEVSRTEGGAERRLTRPARFRAIEYQALDRAIVAEVLGHDRLCRFAGDLRVHRRTGKDVYRWTPVATVPA